jgi:hypothetical protein
MVNRDHQAATKQIRVERQVVLLKSEVTMTLSGRAEEEKRNAA